jgi:hypothetical protein
VSDDQRPGGNSIVGSYGTTGAPVAISGNSAGSNDTIFSGLYAFHIPTSTWSMLCDDSAVPVSLAASGVMSPVVRSRVGHSMLFHPVRKLGQF